MSALEVVIRLTADEAVVLDEILRRYSTSDRLTVEDLAEHQALCNLQCILEKAGDRPLWPSSREARAALGGEVGDPAD